MPEPRHGGIDGDRKAQKGGTGIGGHVIIKGSNLEPWLSHKDIVKSEWLITVSTESSPIYQALKIYYVFIRLGQILIAAHKLLVAACGI